MKCPKCGEDKFFLLDAESIRDRGQCKGGCGYFANISKVAGYWEGIEAGRCRCQPVRVKSNLIMIAISGECDQHKHLLDKMEESEDDWFPEAFSKRPDGNR